MSAKEGVKQVHRRFKELVRALERALDALSDGDGQNQANLAVLQPIREALGEAQQSLHRLQEHHEIRDMDSWAVLELHCYVGRLAVEIDGVWLQARSGGGAKTRHTLLAVLGKPVSRLREAIALLSQELNKEDKAMDSRHSDKGQHDVAHMTEAEWRQWLTHKVETLPFFGHDIVPGSGALKRGRGEPLSLEDERRALLSWLAGGSATQKARRAGISRRGIYDLLARLFYIDDPVPMIAKWHDLGLIAWVAMPSAFDMRASHEQSGICLICHRQICAHNWPTPEMKPGTMLRPDPGKAMMPGNGWRTVCRVQGHLLLHFCLQEDPDPARISWWRKRRGNEVPTLPPMTTKGAWGNVPTDAKSFAIEAGYNTRSELEVPHGADVSKDPLEWRRWRLSLLAPHKPGSLPPPIKRE